jgi:outer membrane receptor for ferrienterochelin and colicins
MGHNLQINGLSNDFITILVDGKRMTGDIGGSNDLSRITMANVERIEVVKGASSSLYGSDAIGGVINIITKKNKQKVSFINNSYVSDYNTFNQDNILSFNQGRVSSKTHFSSQQSDGWKNSPYELDDDSLVISSTMTQNAFKTITLDQTFGIDMMT